MLYESDQQKEERATKRNFEIKKKEKHHDDLLHSCLSIPTNSSLQKSIHSWASNSAAVDPSQPPNPSYLLHSSSRG